MPMRKLVQDAATRAPPNISMRVFEKPKDVSAVGQSWKEKNFGFLKQRERTSGHVVQKAFACCYPPAAFVVLKRDLSKAPAKGANPGRSVHTKCLKSCAIEAIESDARGRTRNGIEDILAIFYKTDD